MHTNPTSAIQQLWDQCGSLVLSYPTPHKIPLKNTSAHCSPPYHVLLPLPWHCLFTITNSDSMPLISISVVLSWTLFLLFFYSCIVATGKGGRASPAYSRLGRWWYCHVYLLCVTCVSTMHVTVLWYPESLFHLPPSLMEVSSPPAAKKEKNLRGLKEGVK